VLSRVLRLAYVQLGLYLAIWVLGIYINGFVPSPADTGGSPISFLLSHVVITHFLFGTTAAALGLVLLTLGLVHKLQGFSLLIGLSLVAIATAATGGLSFVFEIGSQTFDSMLMATSFITAVFLSFFAVLRLRARVTQPKQRNRLQNLSLVTLGLFYVVFISGIYVNLFVASSVFSEPPFIANQLLAKMIVSPPALVHETSGVLLLVFSFTLTVTTLQAKMSKLAIYGAISSLLVTYSLLEGVMMNVIPALETPMESSSSFHFLTSVIAPLVSAAGFLTALLITMGVVLRIWRLQASNPIAK
jgi:hypothetical protein